MWALVALALLPGVRNLQTVNSPEIFFPKRAAEIELYQRLQQLFGNDQALRLMVSGEEIWTTQGLEWLGHFEQAVATLPSVARTVGPVTLAGARQPWPPTDPQLWVDRLIEDPLVTELGLFASGGKLATVLVLLAAEQPPQRTLDGLRLRLAQAPPPPGITARLVGLPVLDETLNTSSREIGQQFFPLLILFAVVLLAAAFRTWRGVIVPLVFVAVCQAIVFGTMALAGVRMNLLMAVLAPLLFVISMATAVHLLICFRSLQRQGLTTEAAVHETYRIKGWAVLWTGLTTLVGFASLTVSPIIPVRSLGLWFGIGILLMTAAAFTFYPALLLSWPGHSARRRQRSLEPAIRRLGERWARWSIRWRRPLLAALGLSFVAALAGTLRLEVESNALHYLATDHPLRAAVEELEDAGVGSTAVELLLSLPEEATAGTFATALQRRRLQQLTSRLRRLPEVVGAISVADLFASGLRRFGSSGFNPGLSAPAGPSAEDLQTLGSYLSEDGLHARITLFTPTTGAELLDPIQAEAQAASREIFPQATVELTGLQTLLLGTQRKLLRTLGTSFALTALFILLILRFILGGWKLAWLAMPPNLWPIFSVLGMMGWAHVPLDIATAMVASMLLGLAVDDTLHTLGHYRQLAPRLGREAAIAGTLERTAAAYLLTGIILSAGFGVCALSNFAPTARFGALAALGIVLAVVADLFLLPAILAIAPAAALARLECEDCTAEDRNG